LADSITLRRALQSVQNASMTKATNPIYPPPIIGDSSAILSDGKRSGVRADEKLRAFLELESAIRACGKLA
jgi:hypothetical protein